MELFVGFTNLSNFLDLEQTLEAWDQVDDIECIGIHCPEKKFEIYRRVSAENLAEDDYILCDLGRAPNRKDIVSWAHGVLKNNPTVGIIGKTGVRICRRGIVKVWPEKTTDTYDEEHVQAYRLAGFGSYECTPPLYRRTSVS